MIPREKMVVSFSLSRQALEKIDRIAYSVDKSRSSVLNSLLLNLSEYTITKYGKKAIKETTQNADS